MLYNPTIGNFTKNFGYLVYLLRSKLQLGKYRGIIYLYGLIYIIESYLTIQSALDVEKKQKP